MDKRKVPEEGCGFDRDLARELLALVKIAHERFDQAKQDLSYQWENDLAPILNPVDGFRYEVLANLGFAQYFFLKRRRVPFGFIARRKNQTGTFDIYVVFRGTVNPAEWISNFKFTQQSYEKSEDPTLCKSRKEQKSSTPNIGEVHRGFYKTYTRSDPGNLLDLLLDLNPQNNHKSMRDVVEEVLENPQMCPPGSRVFVTGHSLGGALAILATLHIHITKTIPFEFPILYAFANPRVGDRQFARHFDKLECYRIANSEDIVPVAPLPSLLLALGRTPLRDAALPTYPFPSVKSLLGRLDYEHVGQPVYFTVQKGFVSENHIIPTYMEALS